MTDPGIPNHTSCHKVTAVSKLLTDMSSQYLLTYQDRCTRYTYRCTVSAEECEVEIGCDESYILQYK